MRHHAELPVEDEGEPGMREFRKHASWYVQGYAVGQSARQRLGMVRSLAELDEILAGLDGSLELPDEARRMKRGHTDGPRPVALPEGWLELVDDPTPPVGAELLVSGG